MANALLLRASRSASVRRGIIGLPLTRRVVERFIAGEDQPSVLRSAADLVAAGLAVTVDRLGEDVRDPSQAGSTARAYVELLEALAGSGLAAHTEVSVKLSALGQALPGEGERLALTNALSICAAAQRAGTTVTVDMEDHRTVDSTLRIVRRLRADYPWVGAVLQAGLRRTERDCRELALAGSRVRLVKGAYREPTDVAYRARSEVDAAYLRCLRVLMSGAGYPMIATHDPRMLDAARELVTETDRDPSSYEFQLLFGIRAEEQRALHAAGHQVRVYLPYGQDWYGYFMRRLAERPANVAFFLRALTSR